MNWSTILALTLLLLVIAFSWLRAEPKRRAVVNWVMVYPAALVLLVYAWFFSQWVTVAISLAAAALIVGAWWYGHGKKLPPPTSDNIKVWGQETGSNKPIKPQAATIAALEEEVERLKKEKEEIEEELRKMKSKQNGK